MLSVGIPHPHTNGYVQFLFKSLHFPFQHYFGFLDLFLPFPHFPIFSPFALVSVYVFSSLLHVSHNFSVLAPLILDVYNMPQEHPSGCAEGCWACLLHRMARLFYVPFLIDVHAQQGVLEA